MPTYTYRCTACGNQFDVRQSMSEDPLHICEKCGGNLRKIINSVGIVFKGSGFYRTDSASSSKAAHAQTSHASSEEATPGTDTQAHTGTSAGSSTENSASSTGAGNQSAASSGSTKPTLSAPGRLA